MFLTSIWSLIMPPVKFSLYFYKEKEPIINYKVVNNHEIVGTKMLYSINGSLDKTSKAVCKLKSKVFYEHV